MGEKDVYIALVEGNPAALEAAMRLYGRQVYHFALKLLKSTELAEEITQDVFIKLWESRGELGNIESLPAWLYAVSRNCALNALKESAARHLREEHYAAMKQVDVNGEEEVVYRDLRRVVAGFVDALPPKRKEIFRLKSEQGLTTEEISRQLNISPHTVKKQLSQSYLTLRRLMKESISLLFFTGIFW